MAALHDALQTLSPTSFSSVPKAQAEAATYLRTAFRKAQTIIESVPLPPPSTDAPTTRPRSSTTASIASNISSSSARAEPLDPAHLPLQKEWGKPIKLNAKDNPLGISVYKLAGKDGRGAWFARRSVHEGMGFRKWKLGLQREFPETLEVQGGPGEGNIRGIGGERRVERMAVEGVGTVEVYHLSAQFPGPTAPRDFVTLLLTSANALSQPEADRPSSPASDSGKPKTDRFANTPRHFMVISRPCDHPDCPPRDGYVRGQYESVEFIREVPMKVKKAASTSNLLANIREHSASPSLEKEAILRNAEKAANGSADYLLDTEGLSPTVAEEIVREGRKRGKTISFAGSRGASAKGEAMDNPHAHDDDDEMNPVEWIMITRSDPGGNVPRFMVERGTPGSIVADASKFLDWATKKEHPEEEAEALEKGDTEFIQQRAREELDAYQANINVTDADGAKRAEEAEPPAIAVPRRASLPIATEDTPREEAHPPGLLATMAGVAYAGLETYAPQAVIDRLPGHHPTASMSNSLSSIKESPALPNGTSTQSLTRSSSITSTSSIATFASAEEQIGDTSSIKSLSTPSQTQSSTSKTTSLSPHEKELQKLQDRKRALDSKLTKAREKESKDKETLTSKEEDRIRKAEEKHAREVSKQEEKYKKEIARLEAKRVKEAAKIEERRKKMEDKDEKARLIREKEEMRQELEVMSKERDILREQVGALQKENTVLVVRLGKMEKGSDVLREIRGEVVGEGQRSRSGSLRRGAGGTLTPEKEKSTPSEKGIPSEKSTPSKKGTPSLKESLSEKGKEATVLAGDGAKKVLDGAK